MKKLITIILCMIFSASLFANTPAKPVGPNKPDRPSYPPRPYNI